MTQTSALETARAQAPLLLILATLAAFMVFGPGWLADLSNPLWLALMFGWLFATILWAALKVVHHADCLAVKLGEPYGTLILTLSVISIEVLMISALMLGGSNNPTLARDTMFAVIMIVLNGMVGVTLLLGALRHYEQRYNLQGANAYLVIGLPAALGGFIIATLVLTPEAVGAVRAALANHLQRAVNIFLGSVLATIGLTVPAALGISLVTGRTVELGLQGADPILLVTTLLTAVVTFSAQRTYLLLGVVHLILFLTYLMLIFEG